MYAYKYGFNMIVIIDVVVIVYSMFDLLNLYLNGLVQL